MFGCFFFQAEDGIRDLVRSRGLGDVYKRQAQETCSDIIGGGAEPGEYSYELDGEQSPGSLSGQVEFFDDRVTMIQVNSEVELPNGVTFDTGWDNPTAVSYTHLRAHETVLDLVCRLLLEKKKTSTSLSALTHLIMNIQLSAY